MSNEPPFIVRPGAMRRRAVVAVVVVVVAVWSWWWWVGGLARDQAADDARRDRWRWPP